MLTPIPGDGDAADETLLPDDALTQFPPLEEWGGGQISPPPLDDTSAGDTKLAPLADASSDETTFPLDGATPLGVVTSVAPEPPPRRTPAARPITAGSGGPPGTAASGGSSRTASPSEGPLAIGQAFGTRYHIIRLLGTGGMGAVYQAWDAELGVAVAIKVIRPEITADPASAGEVERRFKRELLLARQVTHPNVVRIHDLGEIDGIKYITMQYVEGSDLATVLKEAGKLPVAAALRIARQVASGLLAAHAANIVHRDLKPANIVVEQDRAMIMDFGIARSGPNTPPASEAASGPGSLALLKAGPQAAATVAGAVVGTLEYMAPEQARAQPVDHRADIYAFGLILSDMLIGRRSPAGAGSAIEELRKRIENAPTPLRSVAPGIPEAIERIVTRCLQPDPALRYQTTAELVEDLDRLDENGEPIPIRRVVGLPQAVAVIVLLLALSGGAFWYFRPPPPPVQREPISVVVSDFENRTGNPAFDRTLEPTLRIALEGTGFITAYDRTLISRTGARAPEKLDEAAAQQIAVKQGLRVVVSGSLDRQGSGYALSVKAAQAATGNEIVRADARAPDETQILAVATRLAMKVRQALGDDTSDSARRFEKDTPTLSTASLDVVRNYALGMEANSGGRFDEARQYFLKAAELDPKFGLAYGALAVMADNLGQQQEAQKYVKEAIRHLDSMTEREKFRTRGTFSYLTGDYKQCVKEYRDLIERYAADVLARNNLATCSSMLRQWPTAVEEMRRVAEILPKRALYRVNWALYAAYGGDYKTAEREARAALELGSPLGWLPLAFAQHAQGQVPPATESYQKLSEAKAYASFAASGLGDLALYEGRFADAARLLADGAAADLVANNPDKAAAKFAALASTRLQQRQMRAAVAAADQALAHSQAVKIRFLAGRIYIEAGETARAAGLASGLSSELQSEPQAYGKILLGQAALKRGERPQAIKAFQDANELLDTWIGHFELGRAYFEARTFIQADSEFERCLKRRGEAIALFLDEEPTYGFLPAVYYYQGRVKEGMNSANAAEAYRTYVRIRGTAGEDPLLPEVKKRIGANNP